MGLSDLRFMAVSLGREEIRAARFTHDGLSEARLALPVGAWDDPDFILQRLNSALRQLWPSRHEVAAIGVSVPGLFDYRRGLLLHSALSAAWHDLPLRDALTTAFNCPVFVGRDVDLMAMAEYRFGAGQGVGNLIYLHLGRWVEGGILVDGHLFVGGNGLGGQVGRLWLEVPPWLTKGGGVLELRLLVEWMLRYAHRRWRGEQETMARCDLPLLVEAARSGDRFALQWWAALGRLIGTAIVELMYLFNPQRFIFGGWALQAGNLFLHPLREMVVEHAPAIYREGVLLQRAALEEEIALWGALAYLLTELGIRPGL